jgi:hypothetical protein
MKLRYAGLGLLLVTLATPALAAEQHFAVKDTVGVCSVIDVTPSRASNLQILGNKSGYSSVDAAQSALKSSGSKCKDIIDRA